VTGPGTVLVTDAGSGSAISVIRSLGRRGFRVVAADSHPRSAGFASRFAAERLVYPPPDRAPARVVDALVDAAHRRSVDLIIPVSDETVLPLSAHRQRFAGVCALALPAAPALAVTYDKHATVELAARVGVPAPRSILVTTPAGAAGAAEGLGWPVVVKPQAPARYRPGGRVEQLEVTYAEDQVGLSRQLARLEGRGAALLQEYCPGTGQGVELLLHEGRPLAAFQHRRLREVPFTGGQSSFRESVSLDPVLYDFSARLLGALRWTGLAMVEFKDSARGPRLMEINGRIWGSLPLAVKSGMDFPGRVADLFLAGPPPEGSPPATAYATGVRSRKLELELFWIASALRGRSRHPFLPRPSRAQGLRAAARLLSARDGFDVLQRGDLRPAVAEVAQVAGIVARRLGARH
jgi:predicted ATP-grasp superfamily ATP-dependent carboligase